MNDDKPPIALAIWAALLAGTLTFLVVDYRTLRFPIVDRWIALVHPTPEPNALTNCQDVKDGCRAPLQVNGVPTCAIYNQASRSTVVTSCGPQPIVCSNFDTPHPSESPNLIVAQQNGSKEIYVCSVRYEQF